MLDRMDEDRIECACEFILHCTAKIGKSDIDKVDRVLTRLNTLKEEVSTRIRFKIMDVFDAQSAGWCVRRSEAGPTKKTAKYK
jgi:hypothetical protein